LKCWTDGTSNPAWAIQPLKKELLSTSPRIVQVYEFVGDKTISKIRSLTRRTFRYSYVVDTSNPSTPIVNLLRTSVTSRLSNIPTVPEFDRDLEFLLGMNVTAPIAADRTSFIEYVYGNQYGVHPDALGDGVHLGVK
jgi:hypothetical protein